MKKLFLFKKLEMIVLILIAFTAVHAQAKFGIRVGGLLLNQHNTIGSIQGNDKVDIINTQSRFGADVALTADFTIGKYFTFSPEVNWLQKRANVNIMDWPYGQFIQTFDYLDIPLNLKLHTNKNPGLFLIGGPSLGYLLGSKDKYPNMSAHGTELYQRMHFGAQVGGGISFGGTTVDVRYLFGLTDVNNYGGGITLRNSGFGFGVGLRL